MKPVKMLAICATVVLILSAAAFINRSAASKTKTDNSTAANGFAVLELFTSEGCSSCPPADALLARVQKEAGNKPVYVLAYHVDYWDRLGWKDVFSNPQYSKRQYQYNRWFTRQVYTPQVIVNGRSEYIGSDESAIGNAIQEALNSSSSISLNMQGQQRSGEMDLDYQVTGNAGNSQLLIAVVQKQAVSRVKKGENEGRTLSHAQIVHELYTIDLPSNKKGTKHLSLPDGFNTQDWEVIGMVQNAENGVITAAARAVLR